MFKTLTINILQNTYEKFQELYWDFMAERLHKKRLSRQHHQDLEPVSYVIDKYKPKSILDVGCGSGRFFKLYKEKNIDVVGIDISEKALKKAKEMYPDIKTIKMRVEDIEFAFRFDLAISNRTLQHITRRNIEKAVKKLCHSCRMVYINELTDSDEIKERIVIYKHSYEELFRKYGFKLVEKGRLGKQTWMLFSKGKQLLGNFTMNVTSTHTKRKQPHRHQFLQIFY